MNFSKSILLLACSAMSILACDKANPDAPTPSTNTGTGTTTTTPSTSSGTSTTVPTPLDQLEAATDYIYDVNTTNIIKLNGASIAVSGTGATATGSTVTITSAGTYMVSGSLTNGQVIVKTDSNDPIKLVLNGVEIANGSTSPIFIDKAKKVILFLAKGSNNKVSDGATYTNVTSGQNAAIYSQSYMAIAGEGNLQVNANFADGIASKDGLLINGGNITINAKDEGIRGKDYLVIRDGNFNITTTSGDGMKSDFETDAKYGYVLIDKGTFKINSQGDGITAQTTLTINSGTFDITTGGGSSKTVAATASAKGFKAKGLLKASVITANFSAADDAINSNTEVIIGKGTFNISSADDGIHANSIVTIQDGNITISKAFEGIEAKTITINNGQFNIISSNDSINATAGSDAQQDDGSFININGGTLILDAQNGDPLDSNGGMKMTNGTVIIHGPAGMEVPIDYNANFVVSKGIILASGSNSRMLQAPSTNSTINTLKLLFNTANNANVLFSITDESGQSIATFKPIKSYASIIFTSDKLIKDKKYNIYTGGTVTGNNVGGYYTGSYSGGTLRGSFTASSSVNNVTL